MKEEFRASGKEVKEERCFVKKIKSFHMGRAPNLFPGVTLEVNDGEFVELLLDLDQAYDTAHRLNVVLIKYTRSIESKALGVSIDFRDVKGEWTAGASG
jgi:hypothetical protein